MSNLQRLVDDKYSAVTARIIKGYRKGDNIELIVKVDDVELMKVWYNFKSTSKENSSKKSTGGKKAYVKIILEALEQYPDLSLEASGFLFKLSNNISWTTNQLINKRSKKPLNIDDFCKILKKSKPTIIKILNELKEYDLLTVDNSVYTVSYKLLQKGGK